jgi:endoglucanase
VTYTNSNDWGSGFIANLTIKNTGTSTITAWTLSWTFPGNQTITNAWNATITPASGSVSAKNLSHNGTITAGGTQSFGFQASYSGSNARPASFTLNGAACSVS